MTNSPPNDEDGNLHNVKDELLSLENKHIPKLYDLELKINHRKPNFEGTLTIQLGKNHANKGYNDKDNIFRIKLHCSSLIVTKAILSANGVTATLHITSHREKEMIELVTDKIMEIDENSSILLKYMGRINTIGTYKDQTKGIFKTNYLDSISGKSDNYIIATHTQPKACRQIFPLIDETICKVPIKLSIITQSKFKVISNEALESDPEPLPLSEMSLFKYKVTPPMAPSIFGFVVGDLELLRSENSKIPIGVYCPIGELSLCKYPLLVAQSVLETLVCLFEMPFPLSKVDMVALPFLSDGAMENWGLITVISSQLLVESASSDARRKLARQLIAHELVHQWVGNLVSFDEWKHLWLNESFATFVGNYALKIAEISLEDYSSNSYELNKLYLFEDMMEKDSKYNPETQSPVLPSIYEITSNLQDNNGLDTQDYFDTIAYERGIILLYMVATILEFGSTHFSLHNQQYSTFFSGVAKFIKMHEMKCAKPLDLWSILNEQSSLDLAAFVHSWIRKSGFPLVKVTKCGDNLSIEQHVFIENNNAKDLGIEDSPFHVPLAIKIIDEKDQIRVLNLVLTDRKMRIEIPVQNILVFNANKAGYYRVVYSSDIVDIICEKIRSNRLTTCETVSLLSDYRSILFHSNSSADDLASIFKIIACFKSKSWKVDFKVLAVALNLLQNISIAVLHFGDATILQKWIEDTASELYKKIGNWEAVFNIQREYNVKEFEVRNMILQLGLHLNLFQGLASKLFKSFVNPSSKTFIPQELFSSMFNLTMVNANQKIYKQVLLFVKSSDVSNLKHTNGSIEHLQTCAVSSLSYASSDELLHKTLNFVMTNIDSKLIELALLGFQFKQSKQDILKLWNWYTCHFDEWMLKSMKKGSKWAQQLSITMKNISTIILGELMQHDKDLEVARESFVQQKSAQASGTGLKDLILLTEEQNKNKQHIGDLCSQIDNVLLSL